MVAWMALAASLAFLAPTAAQAWGDEGHEIIGAIAHHYLQPAVRREVETLLAGDTSGLTRDRGMAAESTWADRFRDSDRDAGQMHYLQTREWHYVDIEIAAPDLDAACFGHPQLETNAASAGAAQDCVVDKIEQFSDELADRGTAPAERLKALQFLLHLVGDLHQPLHAADNHDRGGNVETVSDGRNPSGSLHHYWDTVFVSRLGQDSDAVAQRLIGEITAGQRHAWRAGTPADWAMESFEEGRAHAYAGLPAPVGATYRLSDTYVRQAELTVRVQLERAGVRLAELLNRALATNRGHRRPRIPP
jgi:hypothetical protein